MSVLPTPERLERAKATKLMGEDKDDLIAEGKRKKTTSKVKEIAYHLTQAD